MEYEELYGLLSVKGIRIPLPPHESLCYSKTSRVFPKFRMMMMMGWRRLLTTTTTMILAVALVMTMVFTTGLHNLIKNGA